MSNVKEMTRPVCREISNEIESALKGIEQKYGVKIESKGGTFTSNNYTLRLAISLIKDGEVITKEAEAFKANAEFYGLNASDLGKRFTSPSGKAFEIIGLNTRARKYKILAREVGTNKVYKFSAESVGLYLSRKA